MKTLSFVLTLALALAVPLAAAESPVLAGYRTAAKLEAATFTEFSATRGEAFYKARPASLACATCHGDNPKTAGKHATTSKEILPMAPAANPQRFTDAAKVEKWFKRNCNDVQKRACTATEKGDFITYLASIK
jgi:hypothetical protein